MIQKLIVVDNFYDCMIPLRRSFYGDDPLDHNEVISKLTDIIGSKIKLQESTLSVGAQEEIISDRGCDWIGLIYLSYPYEAWGKKGVRFVSYEGHEEPPEGGLGQVDSSKWKVYGEIPPKSNRLVLFRPNLLHCIGSDLNSDILYQKIILRDGI